MNFYDVLIIGAGPSGMMSALSIKLHNPNLTVAIIEKQPQVGTKLRLTGGGRCNVTTMITPEQFVLNMPQNGKFLYPALAALGPQGIYDYFSQFIELKVEKHDRVFPITNKSTTIVDCLYQQLIQNNIDIHFNEVVYSIKQEPLSIKTNTSTYECAHLVIATGGKTMPRTGSTGDGYDFATSLAHTITPLYPAEVPLKTVEDTTLLQGLSLYDHVLAVKVKNKVKRQLTYDVLFTHYGLSGPGILRLSTDVQLALKQGHTPEIVITLMDHETLQACKQAITKHKEAHPKQTLKNAMHQVLPLPKRLVDYLIHDHKQLGEYTQSSLNQLLDSIQYLTFTIASTLDFEHAFLTMGGVSLKEINPSTYTSKINPNISFIGEVLDLNGWTGGYNLTIAFSSGYLAGKHIADKLKS